MNQPTQSTDKVISQSAETFAHMITVVMIMAQDDKGEAQDPTWNEAYQYAMDWWNSQDVTHQLCLAELRGRIDELGHVELTHGNRFTQTFVDKQQLTVIGRFEQLQRELRDLEEEGK